MVAEISLRPSATPSSRQASASSGGGNLMSKIFSRGTCGGAGNPSPAAGGGTEVLTASRDELNLRDSAATATFLAKEKPAQVILAAAKVGGIHANNTYPQVLLDNLAIQNSVIHAPFRPESNSSCFSGLPAYIPGKRPAHSRRRVAHWASGAYE